MMAKRTPGKPSQLNALVILNMHARSGEALADDVEDALREQGIPSKLVRLKKGEDISAIIAQSTKDQSFDRIIIGGGDGTMNAAAPGLMRSTLPLGILPLGTANDLARTLGLPTDLREALRVIANGHTREIDLGDVNGKLFFNVASVGFSAELAKNLTAEAKRKWGVLGYGLTAFRLLMKSKPFTATLRYGGKEEVVKTLQVAAGNGAYYGGGMKVAEDAQPDNGKLDVYSLELSHWMELVALLPMLRSGTHTVWPTVRGLRVQELELRTRKPMPVNADGELVTMTPAVFKVHRKAIKVFVGQDAA